jgi:hypothetical protein
MIEKIKRNRNRTIRRRKKKGVKKLPRKTLFKPEPRPNMSKQLLSENDPLWSEVFFNNEESKQ